MFFNPNFDRQRHWEIFRKPRGTIIPLPGEASGVICHWDDPTSLAISTILPPQKRTLLAQWSARNRGGVDWMDPKEFELDTPTLMLRTTIGSDNGAGAPPIALDKYHMKTKLQSAAIRIYAMDDGRGDMVNLKPYMIGNIYEDGKVCWGSNVRPNDPLSANNTLWTSPINNDMNGPQHGPRCKKVKHKNKSGHGSAGKVHVHKHVEKVCLCAEAQRKRNRPHEKAPMCNYCGGLDPALELQAELIAKIGRICLCCSGACDADVEVDSAKKGCTCRCTCCQSMCACFCECDLTDEFIKYVRRNATSDLSARRWANFTAKVCGDSYRSSKKKFFAFSEHCDGVFVSYEKDLLDKIRESLIHSHGNHRMVVGPAFRLDDGSWEVDLGGQIIRVPEAQAYLMNSGLVVSPAETERLEAEERARELERARLQLERDERRQRLNELGRTDAHPLCEECGECQSCGNCSHIEAEPEPEPEPEAATTVEVQATESESEDCAGDECEGCSECECGECNEYVEDCCC